MTKPNTRLSFAALIIFTVFASTAYSTQVEYFSPSENLESVTKDIVSKLSSQHYAAPPLDDDLSALLLERYLKYVDPGKLYFVASDIKEFEKYKASLDDQLKAGSVEAGYTIYNKLHERNISRLDWIIEKLPSLINNFDFTVNEYISLESKELPWVASAGELDERWRKRIKNDVLSMRLNEEEDILGALLRRYEYQLKRTQQINADDVYAYYIDTYTKLYDPHTSYFSPQQMDNFRINMSRSLEGIGAVLSQDYEYTKIVNLVSEGPAFKQGGLKASDRIVGVGQGTEGAVINVVGWRLDEVVELIRGDKDTWVRLEVLPAKTSTGSKFISIKRGKVELEDMLVKKKIQEVYFDGEAHKVGVIEVPDFYIDFAAMSRRDPNYRSTTRDVSKILKELEAENVEGIVIDLRNNGGGSLQEANSLIGLFIEAGPTVQIRHANNRVQRQGKFRRTAYYDGPLVVLINRLSASASEIVAGAIQDYQRGLIVGTTSFGKGTVQTLIGLDAGQLKLTESKFYRISGMSTQNRGVEADILYPAQYDPEEVGEGSLTGALPWDLIDAAGYPTYNDFSLIKDELVKLHEKRISDDPDFVFIKEEYAFISKNRDKKKLTLNQVQRKTEREEAKATLLGIENKRRAVKGLALLTSFEEPENPDKLNKIADTEANKDEEGDDDVFVVEAAQILLDSVKLQIPANIATAEGLQKTGS
ncbi:MAG: carboxyl-terminal processing protease [Pseudomonadales bacterium]|jgi:carboxyl-terminal processing protease